MDFSSLALMKTLGQSQSLASQPDLTSFTNELLDLARGELEARGCALYVLEPEGWVLLARSGEALDGQRWLPTEAGEAPPRIQRDIMLHPLGRFCLLAHGEDLQNGGLSTLLALQGQIRTSLQNLHQLARLQHEVEQSRHAIQRRSAHLGGLSHELRTPLNAVLGFCQLLTRNAETTSAQLESLQHIQDHGVKLLGMISEVVEMSRLEAGLVKLRNEPIDLHGLLRELEGALALLVTPRGHELVFELDSSRPLLGDAERISQLVRHVILASSRLSSRGRIRLTQRWDSEGRLQLEIFDDGPRREQTDLEALFDPFTHPQHGAAGSTGLELPISRHYAALMDGWLTVKAQEDGLLWTICLRLGEDLGSSAQAMGRLENIEKLHADQGEVRVLVADDVAINRFLLTSFLQPLGFAVREAENGQEVVDIFSEWQPQVVLTDLIMPVMGGAEAIERIRDLQGGAQALLVAVSGASDEAGPPSSNAQLSKPVQFDSLLQIIQNHLNLRYQYRASDEAPTAEASACPPADLLAELADATALGDVAWVDSLLNRLSREQSQYAQFWKRCGELAGEFDLAGLAQTLPKPLAQHHSPDERPAILLVDDNPTNLKILYRALAGLECRCLVCQSGEAALRISRLTHPVVVLLDVLMPGWDGFETLRRLRNDSRAESPSVIFLSALSDTSDKVRGLEQGAHDYISKPFHPQEVIARVRLQLSLRYLQDQLRHRNHELGKSNQQKNELLGMAAHDLRNPLSVITGYAAILERGLAGALPDKSQALVQNIHSTSKEMQVLLEDLLSVSQIESGHLNLHLKPANPKEIFDGCIQLQNFQATAKEITLHARVEQPVPTSLPLDASKMKQAFANLLSNAIKFSKPYTVVQARLFTRDEMLVWEVTDQGPGIPNAELDKLFQPFQRTSVRATGGERSTGLGLAITKRILEGHGGSIAVDSQVGRGTTFTLEVPIRE
ncbi:hypothetical protein ABS71_20965 [bacterium SCN 62-11]|nr:response regulator [Candidatus Eremiobacteraeota bacterium]ODT56976.1 MAG: hypothetical protein ABS71_20965 [bacterium SCN 62-11]